MKLTNHPRERADTLREDNCGPMRETSGIGPARSRSASDERALAMNAATGAANAIIGAAKVLLGAIALSPFACVNGFYTLALVAARAGILRAGMAQDGGREARLCLWASWLLLVSSVLYIAYSGWAFHHPSAISVHKYVALGIATVTFVEIGVNIYGVVKMRRANDLAVRVLRAVNLASSLVSLVLTQSVLMSISSTGDHSQAWSGACGVFMGALAVAVSIREIRASKRASKALASASSE